MLSVDFLDAVTGATRRLSLPDGKGLDVRIPPGIEDGQTMRLKGQGSPGRNGGPAGDALIEIHVNPHRFFSPRGQGCACRTAGDRQRGGARRQDRGARRPPAR